MKISSPFLYAALVTLIAALTQAKPLWTGWQGPKRDGWVEYFEVPKVWPEKLDKQWTVKVGTGYSTPLVIEEKVFQHSREGEEEVVRAIDLKSGTVIWRKSYPVSFKIGRGGTQHGKGPKSSPTFADGRLFTHSITGVLSAWDAESGDLLWRRDFKDQLEKSYPYWGAAMSPLVDGDRVLAHVGTCEKGALFALDAKSGKQVWKQDAHPFCYSSGRIVTIADVRQLLEWNHDGLCGVDLATGNILWHYPYPHLRNNQNTPTPAFHKGLIMAGGENRGIRCIEAQRSGETWKVKEHWSTREVSLDMSTAIMNDGLLYGFSHFKRGQLFCLDPVSGKIRWTGPPRAGENAMLVAVPGYVLALIDGGELQVLKASGDGYQVVQSYRVAERDSWAPPVLLKQGVLIKDLKHLTRWALPKP